MDIVISAHSSNSACILVVVVVGLGQHRKPAQRSVGLAAVAELQAAQHVAQLGRDGYAGGASPHVLRRKLLGLMKPTVS